MSRTWEERGKWMDEHDAWIDMQHDRYTCHWYPEISRSAVPCCIGGYGTARDAVDAAMADCERTRAVQTPVALLRDLWSARGSTPTINWTAFAGQLREAIAAQAGLWRAEAERSSPMVRGTLRMCADQLEGK